MKYRIAIFKIEPKMVKSRDWVQVDPYKDSDGDTKNYDYRNQEKEEEVEEKVFEQKRENEIDLKGIIDAFNK